MNSIFIDINNSVSSKSVLIISHDVNFIENIKENNDTKLNISYYSENKYKLVNNVINSFDLIVFDNENNDLESFVNSFKDSHNYEINIPLIILEKNISKEQSLYKYSNAFLVLQKPVSLDSLIVNIDLSLNFLSINKKKQFEDGFYFDINRELLFKGKELIKLTKTERKLVKLLAENVNNLVTYEDIAQEVWRGKNFSIYSLRNVVKHIREKTSDAFLKNSSNRGYVINTI